MNHEEMVTELNLKDFDEFTKKGLTFIDFFAEWCMPCVMMAPVIEELSENFSGKIRFGKINVEDNENLAKKFNISSIPNFILLKDGKVLNQFVGAMDVEEIKEKLKEFLED